MKHQFVVKGTENGEQRERLFEDGGDAIRFADTCGWEGASATCVPVEEASTDAKEGKSTRKYGKAAASRYLLHMGYEIIERNWKCKFGGMDVIAWDGDTLCFIEVNTSSCYEHGFKVLNNPSDAKIDRIEKIAMEYLKTHDECLDCHVRFDAIAIAVVGKDRAFCKHYVNYVNAEL